MKLHIHCLDGSSVYIDHSLKKGICLEILEGGDHNPLYYISLAGSDLCTLEISKDEWDRLNIIMINIIES